MILKNLNNVIELKENVPLAVPSGSQFLASTYSFSVENKSVVLQLFSPEIAVASIRDNETNAMTYKSNAELINRGDSIELVIKP